MPVTHDSLLERTTIDSEVRFGKPCIRGHRITVQKILEWLASGASQEQILADYPQLEADDFLAVYAYAAASASAHKYVTGFPWSENALRNALTGTGDRRILEYVNIKQVADTRIKYCRTLSRMIHHRICV